jgi:DNA invertase Pin-like site-specific DNA recombinase
MVAKDTSKKVKSVFQTKMKKGEYIGSYAPYGYKKEPENKNRFIIDEPAQK